MGWDYFNVRLGTNTYTDLCLRKFKAVVLFGVIGVGGGDRKKKVELYRREGNFYDFT